MKEKSFFSKNRFMFVALSSVLLLGACATGALAYLTGSDSAVNSFTVGSVKIEGKEPHYPGNGADGTVDLPALQEVPKDPQIKNMGKNKAVNYMIVDIPMDRVIAADFNGMRGEEKNQELFEFASDANGYPSVGKGWILLDTSYLNGNLENMDSSSMTAGIAKPSVPQSAVRPDKTDAAYCRRLYGYQWSTKPGETTNPLFTKVRLINVIEGFIDNSTQNIIISNYAVQADNLSYDGDAIKTSDMDEKDLKHIWNIYMNQSGEEAAPDANTGGDETLNGSTMNIRMSIDNTHLVINNGNDADGKTIASVDVAYTGKKTAGNYTLESSDAGVATVDQDGNIQAVHAGTCIITAWIINPDDGSRVSTQTTIHVVDVNSGNVKN